MSAQDARAGVNAGAGLSSARDAIATLDARETRDVRDGSMTAPVRETCVLQGALHRGGERMEWSTALLILSGGHLVTPTHVARFTHRGDLGWIAFLAREGQLVVPCDELDALFTEMTKRPGAPLLDIAPDLDVRMVKEPPRRRLSVRAAPDSAARPIANDALSAAPDAVRPRSDALRSATDSIRTASGRWTLNDAARVEAEMAQRAGNRFRAISALPPHATRCMPMSRSNMPTAVREPNKRQDKTTWVREPNKRQDKTTSRAARKRPRDAARSGVRDEAAADADRS